MPMPSSMFAHINYFPIIILSEKQRCHGFWLFGFSFYWQLRQQVGHTFIHLDRTIQCVKTGLDNSVHFISGCGIGYYAVYSSSCECEPCPIGTYNSEDLLRDSCTSCPDEWTTFLVGSISETACQLGK